MPRQPLEPHLAGRRVLVVEDEIMLALALEDTLLSAGGELFGSFASAAEALASLAEGTAPDVAVLDVRVTDGTSEPVAERLAALDVPFVVLSAYGGAAMDGPALRAAPRLSKPAAMKAVLQALRQALNDPDGNGRHGGA
jgi:DNA-binding NtrC family response regulator